MSRQSSQHSALASLTATYTDSEEEAEAEAEDAAAQQLANSSSSVQIIERSPSAMSMGSEPPPEIEDDEDEATTKGGKSLGGLVSYQDDLIDDEAIDDLFTSDSNNTGHDGDDPKEEIQENGQTSSPAQESNAATNDLENGTGNPLNNESNGKKSRIPPEPPGKCAPELQEKILKLYERKLKGGLDMNSAIQKNKNFRNPSIYEKLIKYCDIDELGSNFPNHIFDPHEFLESSFYDELAKAQKELMEKRERDRKERTKVDFVSGTVKKPNPTIPVEPEAKRKSKWDQRGVMPPLLMSLSAPAVQPQPPSAPAIQQTFTTSASGTKSTVINAFGSIKKPKL